MDAVSSFKLLIDASPSPLVLLDPQERVSVLNEGARSILGEATIGRHYITVFRQPNLLDTVEAVFSDQVARGTCDYLANEAGRATVYRVTAGAMDADKGKYVLLTFYDVTAEQEAEQIRQDFVANVSHELKTPLTALLGFIETLNTSAKQDPVATESFLSTMKVEATRMNRLVRDLLSLSRVEADERIRPTSPVDLVRIIASIAETLQPIAETTKTSLTLQIPNEEVVVPGDADQLNQVFSNLIENGLKYAGEGSDVIVKVTTVEYDGAVRGPAAIVTVQDTGAGFDPVHIPRLTERFYRLDSHRSRELGGTGLGLAIVKHIVNRHRGRFRIESTPGEGSIFTVILSSNG